MTTIHEQYSVASVTPCAFSTQVRRRDIFYTTTAILLSTAGLLLAGCDSIPLHSAQADEAAHKSTCWEDYDKEGKLLYLECVGNPNPLAGLPLDHGISSISAFGSKKIIYRSTYNGQIVDPCHSGDGHISDQCKQNVPMEITVHGVSEIKE